jgi:hypothetical protein
MKDEIFVLFSLCVTGLLQAEANRGVFGLELSDETIERLADYYQLIPEHNPILHLVGPCSPTEFATRHILESLTLLEFLPTARFAMSVPVRDCHRSVSHPRDDLRCAYRVEGEKSVVLADGDREVSSNGPGRRGRSRFSEVKTPDVGYITCRVG